MHSMHLLAIFVRAARVPAMVVLVLRCRDTIVLFRWESSVHHGFGRDKLWLKNIGVVWAIVVLVVTDPFRKWLDHFGFYSHIFN